MTAFAKNSDDTTNTKIELSDAIRSKIVTNCSSLRQSLKLLQRADARARTYFGSIYETVSSKYITPLNIRLVKNNLSSVGLIELQTSLAEKKSTFSTDYISYSRSLEELIAIDCRLEPEDFYEKLIETRSKRKAVSKDMATLNSLVTSSVSLISNLKENL